MEQVNQLRDKLRPHLGWHGARLSFLALFLIALFRVKTVNLAELATVFAGDACPASNYKRMQRFFRSFDLDRAQIAHTVVRLAEIPQPWVLSLDRTNWSFGIVHFNILLLAVVHEGIAFPLVWTELDKKGNSHSQERMDLLERFEALFPDVAVAYLTADREFIGKDWLSFLMMNKPWPFCLRMRHSDLIAPGPGQEGIPGTRLFSSLVVGEERILAGRHWVWGRPVFVVGQRLKPTQQKEDEFLILITNRNPHHARRDYAQRWGIETLFGTLKTRGFCLESTHFTDASRLSKLIALLAIAFVWAMKTGLWRHSHTPIRLKSHKRRAQSLFRYGFDHLRRIVTNLDHRADDFAEALRFLSCT